MQDSNPNLSIRNCYFPPPGDSGGYLGGYSIPNTLPYTITYPPWPAPDLFKKAGSAREFVKPLN